MPSTSSLLAVPLVTLVSLRAGTDTKTNLARRLTSIHTRIYAIDNLLLKPYDTAPIDDLADWRRLMDEFTAFVKAKGGPETGAMMVTLNEASEQLIQERERSWTMAIRRCLRQTPPVGLSRLDPARIDFARLDLAEVIQGDNRLQYKNRSVVKVQEDLEKLKRASRYQTQDPRDALELVRQLALTLQLTLEKYHNDLASLRKARMAK